MYWVLNPDVSFILNLRTQVSRATQGMVNGICDVNIIGSRELILWGREKRHLKRLEMLHLEKHSGRNLFPRAAVLWKSCLTGTSSLKLEYGKNNGCGGGGYESVDATWRLLAEKICTGKTNECTSPKIMPMNIEKRTMIRLRRCLYGKEEARWKKNPAII